MPSKSFVDSNVLVYANDKQAGVKQFVAIQVLEELWQTGTGVVSMQVLQEFYSVMTRKSKLLRPEAQELVELYHAWCGGETTYRDIQSAFEIEGRTLISFWDALMLATAVRFGAKRLLTEDLSHGQIIAGVEIVNPFLKP